MNKGFIVVDLGYGDAGKGAHVDHLVRTHGSEYVIRFNGGAQAGHNVVTPEGVHHNFHQFGAGTLAGASTLIAHTALVSPLVALEEAIALTELGVKNPLDLMYISRGCRIVTPFNVAMNQLSELMRGDTRHGSCGMGIGDTSQDTLYITAGILKWPPYGRHFITDKLKEIQAVKRYQARKMIEALADDPAAAWAIDVLTDPDLPKIVANFYEEFIQQVHITQSLELPRMAMASNTPVVFEGAQGVLLDEFWGFNPYTTWSKTTRHNVDKLLKSWTLFSDNEWDLECHGLIRSYGTRHGAGPFPTEDLVLSEILQDPNNPRNAWQEGFRVGPLDLKTLNYALKCNGGTDGIVISHMDAVQDGLVTEVGVGYEGTPFQWDDDDYWKYMNAEFLSTAEPVYAPVDRPLEDIIEEATGVPVVTLAYGPSSTDRVIRTG